MRTACASRPPGRRAPGSATGTSCPVASPGAPETATSGAGRPTSTRHTWTRPASGCGSPVARRPAPMRRSGRPTASMAAGLEPAATAADAAVRVGRPARGRARRARDVDLGARLGEGEETRPEAHAGLGPEEAAEEVDEHALQVGEGDAVVHHGALDLLEHRR